MSTKMSNAKISTVLAFGEFAVAGALILDHSCNDGRTFNFLREKMVRFKRWVAGEDRNMNPDVENNEANLQDADIQANF